MEWSPEALDRLKRVPFFIRRMVRQKVEEFASSEGAEVVTPLHMRLAKERFMKSQADDIKGYSVETCLGADGCSNRNLPATDIADRIELLLSGKGLREFLKERIGSDLKIHNEFRVSVSFCPNSCSRPQIVDVGLIGAVLPRVTNTDRCNGCRACIKVCKERAISLDDGIPIIDKNRCLFCGDCIASCKRSVIQPGKIGFRCLLGGKLGRHPRLGHELPGIFADHEILKLLDRILEFYMKDNPNGDRLGVLMEKQGIHALYELLEIPLEPARGKI